MKHLFIVNPAAGKGKTINYITKIHEIFTTIKEEYFIEITEKPGHAIEIVKKYVAKGDYRIYSIGGDGTLNEVLNGMVGTNSSLGIIPAGTGNDFIRSVKKFSHHEDILQRTIFSKEKLLDLARVNGRYYLNIASVGLDAEIAYNAKRFKQIPYIPGQLAYFLGIFTMVFKYKSQEMNILIDNKKLYIDTLLLAVANGRFYGGGMQVAPKADLEDGLFDICHIRDVSIIRRLFLFPRLIKGKHESIEQVTFYKVEKVVLQSATEISLNVDGEIFREKEFIFELMPKAIKIIVPE